ncbi:MAG: hypothetical protein GF383_07730 [Candidatus Lokiarchaeota archaeon]|nr:hypothetical protein [Candidatus Lokiarchaeota archaeon]MBD3340161.1 hypothetical protein [Candidatus Lokiarchaeota archaeon]
MTYYPIIDDIGSIPLPDYVNSEQFKKLYWTTYKAILSGKKEDIKSNRGLKSNVILPILDSFKLKLESGLEIPSYSRHWDMHTPFLNPIGEYSSKPFLIDDKKARIIEVEIIREYAKDYYNSTGKKIRCRVCATGALELYLKARGYAVYKDMALNLAKSVNAFLKNSLFNDKYFETPLISIDEPSIGLITYNQITDDDITDILEVESSNINADVQIHLHSLIKSDVALNCRNIDILTCEYASNIHHIIPKKKLDSYDKFIRVGITRTNISNIIAEYIDKGVSPRRFETTEGLFSIIDSKERIKKRYKEAKELYSDRLKYVGPDCGVIGWQNHNVVSELFRRTVEAVKEMRNL